MERGPIGRYVTGDLGAASYRAFLPGPLPPSPPLELARLLLPLVQAQRALTRMDATASVTPQPRRPDLLLPAPGSRPFLAD